MFNRTKQKWAVGPTSVSAVTSGGYINIMAALDAVCGGLALLHCCCFGYMRC